MQRNKTIPGKAVQEVRPER